MQNLRTTVLIALMLAGYEMRAQVLFSENFNNAGQAATRFTTFGSVQYTGGTALLGANSGLSLNSANSIADTGAFPVRYSILQTFGAGSIVYPNGHEGDFFIRMDHSESQYYRIVTYRNSLGPYIAIDRVTTNEPGVISTTLVGGSMYAPPALYTLGPYTIDITVANSADAVDIEVSVGGVHALSAHDTSPYRLVSGDSLAFGYFGTQTDTIDNLSVTVVPEPALGVLLAIGLLMLSLRLCKQGLTSSENSLVVVNRRNGVPSSRSVLDCGGPPPL